MGRQRRLATTVVALVPAHNATEGLRETPGGLQSLVVEATPSALLSTYAEELKPRHTNSYAYQVAGDVGIALMPLILSIEKCNEYNDAQVWIAKLDIQDAFSQTDHDLTFDFLAARCGLEGALTLGRLLLGATT